MLETGVETSIPSFNRNYSFGEGHVSYPGNNYTTFNAVVLARHRSGSTESSVEVPTQLQINNPVVQLKFHSETVQKQH